MAAFIKQDDWKLGLGIITRNNEGAATQPRSNLLYIGATNNDSKQVLIHGIDNLSKRSACYIAAGHIANDGTAALALSAGGSVGAGMGQTGIITGIKQSF